jgi:hypothetical protein
MKDSSSISFKKNHVYIFLAITTIAFIAMFMSGNKTNAPIEKIVPGPTQTIIVPSQNNPNRLIDDTQSQLDELREQNCRLSQDLLFQSSDLSRQANDLDFNSDGFDNFDQVQNLRRQSIDLLIKSQDLSSDC